MLSIVGEPSASPPSSATDPCRYGPATTSASFASAAAFATAARVLRLPQITELYAIADDALERAERAWSWAVANPSVIFRNNEGDAAGVGAGQRETDDAIWPEGSWSISEPGDGYQVAYVFWPRAGRGAGFRKPRVAVNECLPSGHGGAFPGDTLMRSIGLSAILLVLADFLAVGCKDDDSTPEGGGGSAGAAGATDSAGEGPGGSGGGAGAGSRADELDAWIEEEMAAGVIPGMAVALVDGSGVLWSRGFGFANLEEETAATADTPFHIASISKTFVGVALMQAVEKKVLTLEDDINDHLPFTVDNPHRDDETITLRHLGNHTSSIIDDMDVIHATYVDSGKELPLGKFLEGYLIPGGEFYDAERNYSGEAPGADFSYSNVGAALAAHALESATGIAYDELTKTHIFEPLGMSHTAWRHADLPIAAAVPYAVEEGEAVPLAYYGYPTYPDGALKTTANDLGRFLATIINQGELDGVRILKASNVEEMLRSQVEVPLDMNITGQGIFWERMEGACPRECIGHSGGDPGASTFMFFMPEMDVGFLALANTDSETALPHMILVIQRLLGELEAGTLP